MTLFCRLFLLCVALAFPAGLWAQTAESLPEPDENPRGYIQGYLEDALSGAGREVRVIGFRGALSSRAQIDELTIADDDGIWLSLKDITLDWNRAALLSGIIDITELTAKEVQLSRAPTAKIGAESTTPEATEFSLPELPVSVNIEKLALEKVAIGAPVLGRDAIVALNGAATLAGGAGTATLSIERTDGTLGTFAFEGAFSNLTRNLTLSLDLTEGEGGIAANLLDLPGAPSVGLTIKGDGPLHNFSADVALKTDGESRLKGRVVLNGSPPAQTGEEGETIAPNSTFFAAELGGDLAPVFAPAYRDFFGPDIRLILQGEQSGTGETRINQLSLKAAALDVQGQLDLDADHWPARIGLKGTIAAPNNAPVLLPLTGPQTRVTRAGFSLTYDSELGENWTTDVTLANLRHGESAVQNARLFGGGTLTSGEGGAVGRLAGKLALTGEGLVPENADLARALGRDLSGGATFEWIEDKPLKINSFALAGENYGILGSVTLAGLLKGLNLKADGRIALNAADLSRFDGLTGLPLKGAAQLKIEGTAKPLSGFVAVDISGSATDIGIGQPRIDPLLKGTATLATRLERDEVGTRLTDLTLQTGTTKLSGTVQLRSDASAVTGQLDLSDLGMVVTGANGPASLAVIANQNGPMWTVQSNGTGPGNLTLATTGTLKQDADGDWQWQGEAEAKAETIAPYRALAQLPVSGGISLKTNGNANVTAQTFALDVVATTQSIAMGNRYVDGLMRGQGNITTKLTRVDKRWRAENASITTPQFNADAAITLADDGTSIATADVKVNNIGLFVSGVQGAAVASATAKSIAQGWQIDGTASGPGGIGATVNGTASADGRQLNLKLDGTAPLALADQFIAPRSAGGIARYDLRVAGPAQLSSLSGTVAFNDARVSLPNLRMSLYEITGTAQLTNGQARLDLLGYSSTGGRFDVDGPIGLEAPNNADLNVKFTNIGIKEAGLYESTIKGELNIKGPITGGARISGALDLGQVEMRVSETQSAAIGSLPGLKHIHEPADVRRTRRYAGLLDVANTARGVVDYGLDVLVRAPARIFVRGRGLDAELGGQLRLLGTTSQMIPEGRFDLIRGRLNILGRRLDLTEGFVTVQGDFNAYLNLVAESQVDDVLVQVELDGLVSDPKVSFNSVPSLPEDEVLSLLLFGRDLSNVSPLQAVQLAAAVATLAGKGGDGLVSKLRKRFKLDDLDVSTTEDGTTKARAGKYISEKVYSDVTIDSEGKTEINLNINISPNVTATGRLGSDGSSGIGLYFEKDY